MYKYYNPNRISENTGDCVIRAITKATNQSWDKVYWDLCDLGFIMGDWGNSNKDIYEIDSYQDSMGYSQTGGSYTNGNSYAMRDRSNRMNPMYNKSYGRGSSYGRSINNGYSRDESKSMMLDRLQEVMDMAVDEKDRKAVSRLMEQMSQN